MKSSKSFCNPTLLRKNFTRYAPVWVLYSICLFLGTMLLTESGVTYHFLDNLAESMKIIVLVNLCYALIVAQMLFGDLYNTRMCNAMHAMPMRRESYYATNVLTGLLFSLLPTLAMLVLTLPLSFYSYFANGWQIALLWFACANLSYLAFFGIAVLAAFLAGNRLAMACCYGIVNFASMLAYALTEVFLTPLLFGVKTWTAPFFALCPVYAMCDGDYVSCWREYITETSYIGKFALDETWQMLGIYAAVGAVLLVVSLLLYRRRALECAGDFLAVRVLEPIFLVIYTLAVGIFGYLVPELFLGTDEPIAYVFLFCGLIIGFFTGKMLLTRTTRVWSIRNVGGCAAVIVGLAITMGITALDPAGIETRMPDANEIEAVVILPYNRTNAQNVSATNIWGGDRAVATTDAEITRVLHLHELALEQRLDENTIIRYDPASGERLSTMAYTLSYRLKDGSYVNRYYTCVAQEESGKILSRFFNDPKTLFAMEEESEFIEFAQNVQAFCINGEWVESTTEQMISLVQALFADAKAGHLANYWTFHDDDCSNGFYIDFTLPYPEEIENKYGDISAEGVTYVYRNDYSTGRHYGLNVYSCSENTIRWMQENYPEIYQQILAEYEGYK